MNQETDPDDGQNAEVIERRLTVSSQAGAAPGHSGYLTKMGGNTKRSQSWKKRFFQMTDDAIAYLVKPGGAVKGGILMESIKSVRDASSVEAGNKLNVFAIVTAARTYIAMAESEADKYEWMAKITANVAKVAGTGGGSGGSGGSGGDGGESKAVATLQELAAVLKGSGSDSERLAAITALITPDDIEGASFANPARDSLPQAPPVAFGVMSTAEITGKTMPGMTTVVAVASRDVSKAQAFIEKNAKLTKSGAKGEAMTYDDIVAHPAVEAIYCPLPTGLRNQWLSKAIAAGKHIYSEKPMGGTVSELKALLDECTAKGVQWMDGTMWYHSNRTRAIEQLLASGELGAVKSVNAAFTFHFPDQEWLDGGNGRTNKTREPMGCLGDQGWYTLSAILWAFGWELPERVMTTSTTLNKVDTIVACSGVVVFKDGRVANFDCGCTATHRSQYEIVCENGSVRVDDLVGGQGRSGDFSAYFVPFVGSGKYTKGDVMGKDTVVEVPECDHVDALVNDFSACVDVIKKGGKPNPDWPRRSLAVHTVMSAVFESAYSGGKTVQVGAPESAAESAAESGPDNYAWKDAGFKGKTAVIMGYGGGVADVILQGLTEAGCKVAIISRTQSKLDAAAAKYNATLGAGTVQGFSFDMSNTAGVKDLLASIGASMGPIKVIYYNAVKLSLPHDAPAEEVVAGSNINMATLWSSFGAMLAEWSSSNGGGVFLMSGGGFANNGAYSVPFNAQFGSTQKSFMKNFAEGAQATHADKGVHVCAFEINQLVFGGANIPDEFNKNPEDAKAFEGRLKAAVATALADKKGTCYQEVS